jgi:hypothetical protein
MTTRRPAVLLATAFLALVAGTAAVIVALVFLVQTIG